MNTTRHLAPHSYCNMFSWNELSGQMVGLFPGGLATGLISFSKLVCALDVTPRTLPFGEIEG